MRYGPQEGDLFAITAAPFAKQKIEAQSDAPGQRQPAIQCFGLKTDCFLAAWGDRGKRPAESFKKAFSLLHYYFVGQRGESLPLVLHFGVSWNFQLDAR